ncbi:MAG: hypothetical protein Q7J51_10975, partial [Sheuella sp.]|nr:hypothetical protein [Sheuella sp.]
NWSLFGTVSSSSALLLGADANTRVYLDPSGTAGSANITFRAWDQSTGTAGTKVDLSNASTRGGTTAFSTSTDTATIAITPIAMDLDGNGIHYLDTTAGVTYDYNNDGTQYKTAWVGPEDGMLARLNDDGSLQIVFSLRDGQTDMQGLAEKFDTNKDGVLDVTDAEFKNFGVWQDVNSDATATGGEFKTLTEHGITSISLVTTGDITSAANGDVTVFGKSTYTMKDGTVMTVEDVAFSVSSIDKTAGTATNLNSLSVTQLGSVHDGSAALTVGVDATHVASTTAVTQTGDQLNLADNDTSAHSVVTTATDVVAHDSAVVTHDPSHVDLTGILSQSDSSSVTYTASSAPYSTDPLLVELGGVMYEIPANQSNEHLTTSSAETFTALSAPAPLGNVSWTEVVDHGVSTSGSNDSTSAVTPTASPDTHDAGWTAVVDAAVSAEPGGTSSAQAAVADSAPADVATIPVAQEVQNPTLVPDPLH